MAANTKNRDPLLWRFSLYGFLKNQQYYEPFFLLVLQAKGLSFFQIGLLYSFREICVNVLGVPAGFLADLYGRRSSLLICFSAYIASFLGFALTANLPWLFASMFAFAVGESFRSGTHKSMIFHHLRLSGRESEKTVVYGFTRSWSKIGSAVSSLLSGLLVLFTGSYARIFLFTIPPYLVNMVNVGTYPKALEGEMTAQPKTFSVRAIFGTMVRETRACVGQKDLRGLFVESAVLQAIAKTVKEYLQPLVVASMTGFVLMGPLAKLDQVRRSAFLLGILYFLLNGVAAWASRNAHHFDALERRRTPWLWIAIAIVGALIGFGSATRGVVPGAMAVAIIGFLLLVLMENIWRPLFLDRLDDVSDSKFGSAVLSVEAQFQSLAVMVCAPVVGKVADHFGLPGVGGLVVVMGIATGVFSSLRKSPSPIP